MNRYLCIINNWLCLKQIKIKDQQMQLLRYTDQTHFLTFKLKQAQLARVVLQVHSDCFNNSIASHIFNYVNAEVINTRLIPLMPFVESLSTNFIIRCFCQSNKLFITFQDYPERPGPKVFKVYVARLANLEFQDFLVHQVLEVYQDCLEKM